MIWRILRDHIVKHQFARKVCAGQFKHQGDLERFHPLLRFCSTQSRQVPHSVKSKWANEIWAQCSGLGGYGLRIEFKHGGVVFGLPLRFPWPPAIAKRISRAFFFFLVDLNRRQSITSHFLFHQLEKRGGLSLSFTRTDERHAKNHSLD